MEVMFEPDDGRDLKYRRRITSIERIPDTRVGHYAVLECGHAVNIFGRIEILNEQSGMVVCVQCRAKDERQ